MRPGPFNPVTQLRGNLISQESYLDWQNNLFSGCLYSFILVTYWLEAKLVYLTGKVNLQREGLQHVLKICNSSAESIKKTKWNFLLQNISTNLEHFHCRESEPAERHDLRQL